MHPFDHIGGTVGHKIVFNIEAFQGQLPKVFKGAGVFSRNDHNDLFVRSSQFFPVDRGPAEDRLQLFA